MRVAKRKGRKELEMLLFGRGRGGLVRGWVIGRDGG